MENSKNDPLSLFPNNSLLLGRAPMGTVNGLPAHILLVHAIVVLLPLAALLLVLTALWPAARRRLAGPNAILSLLVLALVPVHHERR